MLKVTTQTEKTKTTLKVEGKLAGPWVDELERCWQDVPQDHSVRISLDAVTFIDEEGKKLLIRMHKAGAELAAQGCMTKAVVGEITRSFHGCFGRR